MAEREAEDSSNLPAHPVLPNGLELRYDPAWLSSRYKKTRSVDLRSKILAEQQRGSATTTSEVTKPSFNETNIPYSEEVCVDFIYQTLIFSKSTSLTVAQSAALASLVEFLVRTLQNTGGTYVEMFQLFSDKIKKQCSSQRGDNINLRSRCISASISSKAMAQAEASEPVNGVGGELLGGESAGLARGTVDSNTVDGEKTSGSSYYGLPFEEYLFLTTECRLMIDFFAGTFFKHFNLYRYCLVDGLSQTDSISSGTENLGRPLRRVIRSDCPIEQPSPLFLGNQLKDAVNVSQRARDKEARENARKEALAKAARLKAEAATDRDRMDKDRLMIEQDGFNDPDMQKLLVPPELQASLKERVADVEGRIRTKLTELDTVALEEANQMIAKDVIN